ncbi:MAG: CBS domain-containing protein, partial [Cyclobacteriaceae bacterium]
NGSSELTTIPSDTSVGEAIKILNQQAISQIPVTEDDEFVGSLTDSKLLHKLIEEPELRSEPVSKLMDKPFQFVSPRDTLDVLSSLIDKDNKALLVRDQLNQVHIITQSDLLVAMSS